MGRYTEQLLYGTPVYPGATTPDGRIVTEQHQARIEARGQHADTMGALKRLHGGREIVPVSEFDRSGTRAVMAEAARGLWNIQAGQQALIQGLDKATHVSAMSGFEVASQVGNLRSDLRTLGAGLESALGNVTGMLDESLVQGNQMIVLHEAGNRQRGVAITTLKEMRAGQEDVVGGLGEIDDSLEELISLQLETNETLVNLKDIAEHTLIALENGFADLIQSLRGGIERVTFEIAMARIKIIRSLRDIDDSVTRHVGTVTARQDEGNRLLRDIAEVTASPRATNAKELTAQGFRLLERSGGDHTRLRGAERIFRQALEQDATMPRTYYGLGLALQLSHRFTDADEAYENAICFASEQDTSLLAAVVMQKKRIQNSGRNLPNEATFLTAEVKKIASKPAELQLVEAMMLCGLKEEAEKLLLDFLTVNIGHLAHAKSIFGVSCQLLDQLSVRLSHSADRRAQAALFKHLVLDGKVALAAGVFDELLQTRPALIFQENLMGLPGFESLAKGAKDSTIKIASSLQRASAETFYAYALIAFQLGIPYSTMSRFLKKAFESDPDVKLKNADGVNAKIRRITPDHATRFIHYIAECDSDLAWLHS